MSAITEQREDASNFKTIRDTDEICVLEDINHVMFNQSIYDLWLMSDFVGSAPPSNDRNYFRNCRMRKACKPRQWLEMDDVRLHYIVKGFDDFWHRKRLILPFIFEYLVVSKKERTIHAARKPQVLLL